MQTLKQAAGIEGRPDLDVVIEIAEYFPRLACLGFLPGRDQLRIRRLLSVIPGLDPVAPAFQRLWGVTAGVEFFGAVQAQIDEITGEVFAIRPFARRCQR